MQLPPLPHNFPPHYTNSSSNKGSRSRMSQDLPPGQFQGRTEPRHLIMDSNNKVLLITNNLPEVPYLTVKHQGIISLLAQQHKQQAAAAAAAALTAWGSPGREMSVAISSVSGRVSMGSAAA
jgi:hypothetical protein